MFPEKKKIKFSDGIVSHIKKRHISVTILGLFSMIWVKYANKFSFLKVKLLLTILAWYYYLFIKYFNFGKIPYIAFKHLQCKEQAYLISDEQLQFEFLSYYSVSSYPFRSRFSITFCYGWNWWTILCKRKSFSRAVRFSSLSSLLHLGWFHPKN